MSVLANQISVNDKNYFFLEINSKLINTSTLNAVYISTNKLYADEAVFSSIKGNIVFSSSYNLIVSTITANNISTNVLQANTGYISSLTANYISTNLLQANKILLSSIQGNLGFFSTIIASDGYYSTLQTNKLYFSSLEGNECRFSTIKADNGYYSTLQTNKLYFSSLEGNEGIFSTIKADTGFFSTLQIENISTTNLNANNILFSSLKGDTAFLSSISTNLLNIYSTEESTGGISFTTPQGELQGAISAPLGSGLSLFSQNAPLTIVSYDDINILGLKSMANYISTSYILFTDGIASFNASNIFLNSYEVNISTSLIVNNSTTTDYLFANYISSGTGYYSTLTTENLFANYISAGTGYFSSLNILNLSTNLIGVPDIFCSNITISNTTTANIVNIGGQLTLNGATTANQDITMNADINFSVQNLNVTDPLFVNPHDVLLCNINNVNAVNCGSITCIGGAQSNEILGVFVPPFHNASFVTIGGGDRVIDGGVACQAIVTLNGQQPDPANPGTNLTTALSVYGDVEIGALDPLDWGTLTSYNGTRLLGTNPEGLALEVVGDVEIGAPVLVQITAPDTNFIGDVSVDGLFGVTGAVGLLGALAVGGITTMTGVVNANGGVAVLGLFTQSGGDFTVGDNSHSATINAPLTINETTSFNDTITANATLDMANNDIINCRNITVSTINTSTLRLFNLSTTQILLYPDQDFPPAIAFSDLSANITSIIAQLAGDSLFINNTSTILIQAGSNLLMGGAQNAGIVGSTISLTANSNITLFAPETIVLQSTDAGVAINGKNAVVIGNQQDTSLYLTLDNMEGFASTNTTFTAGSNITFNASSITTLNSLSNIVMNTPAQVFINANLRVDNNVVYAGGVETNTLYTENITTPVPIFGLTYVNVLKDFNMCNNNINNVNSISTNSISTNSIRANNISSIFNQVSSMRVQNTLQTSTIQVNRLQPLTDTGTYTGNLYPVSASAFIGYGSNTAQGGYYQQGTFRSTFTQVIHPSLDSGIFSNTVRIQGNVSTQNVVVSSINNKRYPCRSTIGGPSFPSSFSIDGSASATPQLLISSINFFAGVGNYDISQRMAFIKQTGGASVDAHGSILVASTNSLAIPFIDSNFGYGQIPQVNDVGHSTFTTMVTSVFIGSNSQQRQYKYLDATGGNYTGILYLERPVITYIPSFGLNPE